MMFYDILSILDFLLSEHTSGVFLVNFCFVHLFFIYSFLFLSTKKIKCKTILTILILKVDAYFSLQISLFHSVDSRGNPKKIIENNSRMVLTVLGQKFMFLGIYLLYSNKSR